MRRTQTSCCPGSVWLLATAFVLTGLSSARAQESPAGSADQTPATQEQTPPPRQSVTVVATSEKKKPSFEIYGFAMLDIGHDFKQIDPNWFDTMRVSKLPAFENQFGQDNDTFAGVRQSRLGVRSSTPTALGDLKTIFEFELFGTGVDQGQTTFRLRHAYGELGQFGAGQYFSPFWIRMRSRTRWSTGDPPDSCGSATCSCAGRRSG